MANRLAVLGLVAALTVLSSGCYESVTPTRYEAGVYKGASDPLTSKLESGELQDRLGERFRTAAQDR